MIIPVAVSIFDSYSSNLRHENEFNVPLGKKQVIGEKMTENKTKQINIELPEDIAEGTYANLAMVTHSPAEFVMDFTRVMPGVPKAKVKSRIVMTPQHAKMFLNALQENLAIYESQFGEIKLHGSAQKTPFGFTDKAN